MLVRQPCAHLPRSIDGFIIKLLYFSRQIRYCSPVWDTWNLFSTSFEEGRPITGWANTNIIFICIVIHVPTTFRRHIKSTESTQISDRNNIASPGWPFTKQPTHSYLLWERQLTARIKNQQPLHWALVSNEVHLPLAYSRP